MTMGECLMYPDLLAASISSWAAEYREYLSNLDWTQVATVVVAGIGIVLSVLIVFIFIKPGPAISVST